MEIGTGIGLLGVGIGFGLFWVGYGIGHAGEQLSEAIKYYSARENS